MDSNRKKRDRILILLASFFFMAGIMLINSLITGYSESLGASPALMGITGGLMNFCALFFRPFAGNMTDRFRKKRIALFGTLCITIATVGYLTASHPATVIAFRVLNGFGFAFCTIGLSTWVTTLLPPDRIGSGMGLYGMMNALGMAVAPSIGIHVYQEAGYRAAISVAVLFSALSAVLLLPTRDQGRPKREGKHTDGLRIWEKSVFPIALIIMLFALPYCATQSFLVRYVEARDLRIMSSLFFSSYALSLLVMRLSLRSLFDRLSFRTFYLISLGCMTACLLCLSSAKSNGLLILAGIMMAGSYGVMCTVCQSTAMLLVAEERRGVANSTYYLGFDLGMATGPMVGGFLYGNLDLRLFFPMLMICALAALTAYFLFAKKLG